MDADKKYGNLTMEHGGQWAKRPRRAPVSTIPDWQLDREMQAAFEGEDGAVPSRGVYDIRSGDQHPWRVLARRMREARAGNVPKEQVVAVIAVFAMWIEELYAEPSGEKAA